MRITIVKLSVHIHTSSLHTMYLNRKFILSIDRVLWLCSFSLGTLHNPDNQRRCCYNVRSSYGLISVALFSYVASSILPGTHMLIMKYCILKRQIQILKSFKNLSEKKYVFFSSNCHERKMIPINEPGFSFKCILKLNLEIINTIIKVR